MTERIAFVGLGNMGLPMARNLQRAGYDVQGCDAWPEARAAADAAGIPCRESLADALAGASAVVSALPAARHVRAVYLGVSGALERAEPGTLFVDCSTIDVGTARTVSEAADSPQPCHAGQPHVGRRRRRRGGQPDLHGGGCRGGIPTSKADPRGDGEEHLSCRRTRFRLGGEDLQQHAARHHHDRRFRGFQPGGEESASKRKPSTESRPPLPVVAGR